MAMLLCEGFDTYATSSGSAPALGKRWHGFKSMSQRAWYTGDTIQTTGSNFSTACYRTPGPTVKTGYKFPFVSHSTNEVFLGFWCRFQNKVTSPFMWLSETLDDIQSVSSGARNFVLYTNATTGYLSVKQWVDTDSGVDYTGSIDICDDAWHWFEARIQWNDSTGDVETYIDGSADITVNLADTIGGTDPGDFAGWQYVNLRGRGSGYDYYDDILIYDVDGSPSGTPTSGSFPLGETKVETLLPTGSGTNTDWTPWGNANNYACVDEGIFDTQHDETVYTSTVNDIDTYAFGNLSNTPDEIHTLMIDIYGRKMGNSTAYFRGAAYSNATTGATTRSWEVYKTAFDCYQLEMPYDPDTAALWTGAGVNAAEFGVKYTSS